MIEGRIVSDTILEQLHCDQMFDSLWINEKLANCGSASTWEFLIELFHIRTRSWYLYWARFRVIALWGHNSYQVPYFPDNYCLMRTIQPTSQQQTKCVYKFLRSFLGSWCFIPELFESCWVPVTTCWGGATIRFFNWCWCKLLVVILSSIEPGHAKQKTSAVASSFKPLIVSCKDFAAEMIQKNPHLYVVFGVPRFLQCWQIVTNVQHRQTSNPAAAAA